MEEKEGKEKDYNSVILHLNFQEYARHSLIFHVYLTQ